MKFQNISIYGSELRLFTKAANGQKLQRAITPTKKALNWLKI